MPRPRTSKPKYCLDRPSGRAFVRIDGQKRYLGDYESPESRDDYYRVIGEWIAQGRPRGDLRCHDDGGLTVNDVIIRFWAYAQTSYPTPPVGPRKRPSGELGNFWDALRPLRRLYGTTPTASFGPKALAVVREEMMRLGWCKNTINRQTGRVKHIFKWAAAEELIPGTIYHSLSALSGLRHGRSAARETKPVKPVPEADVDPVVTALPKRIAAMVLTQLHSGMRPGEVCIMRTCDIDTTSPIWTYRPTQHKTAHHGHTREIRIGAKAQEALRPFLKRELQAFIFSPIDAEADRLAERHAARKTPLSCGNIPDTNRKTSRRRPPRERYTTASYRRAIQRACDRIFDADGSRRALKKTDHRWSPNRLRHSAATLIRKLYGLDAARAVLGQKSAAVTEIYAEIDFAKAEQVMAQIG